MTRPTSERLATALLRPVNTTGIILLGGVTLLWGLWVANPLWTVFKTAPMFSFMSFMPEWAWGVIALMSGAVMIYGALKPSFFSLTAGSFCGGIFWFVLAIMYFLGDWQNTGGITVLGFAAYAAFIYINVRVNYKDHKDLVDFPE